MWDLENDRKPVAEDGFEHEDSLENISAGSFPSNREDSLDRILTSARFLASCNFRLSRATSRRLHDRVEKVSIELSEKGDDLASAASLLRKINSGIVHASFCR